MGVSKMDGFVLGLTLGVAEGTEEGTLGTLLGAEDGLREGTVAIVISKHASSSHTTRQGWRAERMLGSPDQ